MGSTPGRGEGGGWPHECACCKLGPAHRAGLLLLADWAHVLACCPAIKDAVAGLDNAVLVTAAGRRSDPVWKSGVAPNADVLGRRLRRFSRRTGVSDGLVSGVRDREGARRHSARSEAISANMACTWLACSPPPCGKRRHRGTASGQQARAVARRWGVRRHSQRC